MESHSLLPSNNIKLEPACEVDNVQSSTREIISEIQVFDKLDSKIPADVKIEQPEVYIDYPGEDMEIDPCSQSYIDTRSLQEQSQKEKMVVGDKDLMVVKQELPDILSEGKSPRFSNMEDMTNCRSTQDTELGMPEDTTLFVNHQEVSLTGTENGDTASQPHEYCSHMSESVPSMTEINTKLSLTSDNCQLHHVKAPVDHAQISEKFRDCTVENTSRSHQRIHTKNPPCYFDVCDITVYVDTFLHRSKITQIEEKYSKYDDSAASVVEANNLKCNKIIHTEEKPYMCDDCSATFTGAGSLKYHMRTHTGEKPYKCDNCPASFTGADGLWYHMKTHTGEKPYKCHICPASFIKAGSLKRHVRTHTGEKPYKCDICVASFSDSGNLKCHRRTHTGEKPYKCNICDSNFSESGSLKRHMRTHTGEKPYRCEACTASFTGTSDLKRHKRTHTGEKPYKCVECTATFTGTGSLKWHMRTHTGEKPYKCDACTASFTGNSGLTRHMRTHAGEKPYKCKICSISFNQESRLKSHQRTHTGEKLLQV